MSTVFAVLVVLCIYLWKKSDKIYNEFVNLAMDKGKVFSIAGSDEDIAYIDTEEDSTLDYKFNLYRLCSFVPFIIITVLFFMLSEYVAGIVMIGFDFFLYHNI